MCHLKHLFFLLIFALSTQALMASDNIERFNESLSKYFHLENEELNFVSQKLSPYFESIPDSLMDDFLAFAQEMTLTPISEQTLRDIDKLDAIITAPKAHRIVFENEYLRILESILKPGDIVPFHTHQWDNVILTTQGSRFTSDDGKDLIEEDWPPMVEKIEGSFHAYSYQNIGQTEFQALLFEFKK